MNMQHSHELWLKHVPESLPGAGVAEGDPQGLTVGQPVVIRPDVDGGEQPVEGTIWAANAEEVTLLRQDADCGDLCVHFPRAGYRIDLA